MTSDSRPPRAIKGDVDSVRRISGTRGQDDGLIEVRLVGSSHRFQVRVQMGSGAPRLVELHLLPDSDESTAEIDPATIRQVPVRRLAKAAARFIGSSDGAFIGVDELRDPTLNLRPDVSPKGSRRHKLDAVHYRRVADLLISARRIGESPREYVADRLGASIPTVDRWIKEAKRRNYLPRDWATDPDATSEQENDR